MSAEAETDATRSAHRPVIGVMGGGVAAPPVLDLAEELGRRVAEAGWALLNGGRNAGVMRASAAGAAAAGGVVIGVLPGRDRTGASPHLTYAILTGLGDARNVVNVLSSDVVIALPGGAGTLSEIMLARKNRRPLVLLGWPEGSLAELSGDDVARVGDAAEAITVSRRILENL
jgi:uncharacterized protein (TIGR00725 family)